MARRRIFLTGSRQADRRCRLASLSPVFHRWTAQWATGNWRNASLCCSTNLTAAGIQRLACTALPTTTAR